MQKNTPPPNLALCSPFFGINSVTNQLFFRNGPLSAYQNTLDENIENAVRYDISVEGWQVQCVPWKGFGSAVHQRDR